MAFKTAEPSLKSVLDEIHTGEIQLPDFQRGWVWDDEHIKSLISSVSRAYPIGAVMFLENGGMTLKPRLFEGVDKSSITAPSPKMLVLDGQQRLTSLYLALRSGKAVPVNKNGSEEKLLYFIDMKKCLNENADRDEAIISMPETLRTTKNFGREIELDISSDALQYEKKMFPLAVVFDPERYTTWKSGFIEFYGYSPDEQKFLAKFEQVWLGFQTFRVPSIELSHDTPREAVCHVFEKVNTGGVTLTVFELMTATFAIDDPEFNLRNDWQERRERMIDNGRDVLRAINEVNFLTAVALSSSVEKNLRGEGAITCKRADILKLKLSDFKTHASRLEEGFKEAAMLLAEEKIYDDRTIPYPTQVIPLSVLFTYLKKWHSRHDVRQKLLNWYWCGVFGELYGSTTETRFAFDVPEVLQWIEGGAEPRTVRDSNFSPVRLLSLRSRNAAAYKGLAALLMKNGSRDFISGTPIDINTYFSRAIDIHHIFPSSWCRKQGLAQAKCDSIVNKAPLSAETNRFLEGVMNLKQL